MGIDGLTDGASAATSSVEPSSVEIATVAVALVARDSQIDVDLFFLFLLGATDVPAPALLFVSILVEELSSLF